MILYGSDYGFEIFETNIFCGLFIVLGILALIQGIKRKNENITKKYIGITSIIIIALSFVLIIAFSIYPLIGKVIYKHKYNEDEIIPNDNIWSTLQDTNNDVYINVKRNGKYGYVNQNGKVVIDFKYDYATPFNEIDNNGKKYSIALIIENGMTEIITKDETKLAVFKSFFNGNYLASNMLLGISSDINHLNYIQSGGSTDTFSYLNYVFSQDSPSNSNSYFFILMQIRSREMNTINSLESYNKDTSVYPIKYHYTDTYDIVVNLSDDGSTEKYELVNKNNPNDTITLDCEVLGTSLFSNGGIPFFSTSIGEQGWFSQDGTKHTIEGNYRILDVTDSLILLQDYNQNCESIINYRNNTFQKYKAIGRISEDRYIVEDENNKCFVIDSNFQKIIDGYDIILPLPEINLCICGNVQGTEVEYNTIQDTFETENLPVNMTKPSTYTEAQNINYELLDLNGNKVEPGYFQDVFDLNRQYSYGTSKDELITNLVQLCSNFATDDNYGLYTQQ
ncbi:MAG: WG repeat-containing protein [Oscillospiraceae bacterium]|nr:WG repeat-containing protein [Oscillospiraceae bacterium]